ncbi:MAG: nicotinate-nucleotide diphosphorylase (carboxylating), partial [Cyanobacteriota bacterium]|nr:nicotinate-nucleotide diphosphorylase (carboxylating) [Cyanobacteriota bacterium]
MFSMPVSSPSLTLTPELRSRLESWLSEDLGRGDLTAPALFGCHGRACWRAKADGLFCGGVLVEPLLHALDPKARVQLLVSEGASVSVGQDLLRLEGQASALAAVERTALNLAMRLSGVATATAALVDQLGGSSVRLADTRKTTPGLRVLEKYAV